MSLCAIFAGVKSSVGVGQHFRGKNNVSIEKDSQICSADCFHCRIVEFGKKIHFG